MAKRTPSKAKKSRTPSTSVATSVETESVETAIARPSHEAIARRAYELYLSRGADHGGHEHDWLAAERELATLN